MLMLNVSIIRIIKTTEKAENCAKALKLRALTGLY